MLAFRDGLADRGLDCVVAVCGDTSVHPGVPCRPPRRGRMGAPRLPCYRDPARSLQDLVATAGRRRLRRCTWRQGSQGRNDQPFHGVGGSPSWCCCHEEGTGAGRRPRDLGRHPARRGSELPSGCPTTTNPRTTG
ncbi:transposase [Streptomyces sp. cg2]|uniref:transposase n=1 Tax=Streptomyces sp. cg2 TaxID=3238799 RepID=UPI0034E1D837